MVGIGSILDDMLKKARKDESFRQAVLATKSSRDPYAAFCKLARDEGFELYEMDLLDAADDMIRQMQKGVNGGGGNHSVPVGEGDFYEQFIAAIS